jgi:hypothetical protein
MIKIIKIVTWFAIASLLGCNNTQLPPQENYQQQALTEHPDTNSKVSTNTDVEIKYETYCNSRFGFCIDYPMGILYPQGESDNRDGQVFKSKDAENILWVYRDFRDNINPETPYTIETAYKEDSWGNNPDEPKRVITYKKLGKNFFVISGYNDGKIFYQKTIMRNEEIITSIIVYKEIDKEIYNKIAERIFKSFK